MTASFKLQRLSDEKALIQDGNQIAGTLVWTDSFWMLELPSGRGGPIVFQNCNEIDDIDLAFTQSFEYLTARSADLDFLLDPPTFVGPTDGERACWAYTVWKCVTHRNPMSPTMSEWERVHYSTAQAIYRRVVRKYGDTPPDKTAELKALMAGDGS